MGSRLRQPLVSGFETHSHARRCSLTTAFYLHNDQPALGIMCTISHAYWAMPSP